MESYQRLECEIAEWVGRMPSQVVACSSGTAALHLAFEAMRLSKASEVVMSEFNMIACPRAVSLAGYHPSLVDCDRRLLPNYEQVDWCLNRHANKAVLATHIYGRVCDMDGLFKITHDKGRCIQAVEDMAEAHGCPIHPYSFAACYSFYKNKVVHGEEGGCVVFKDPCHADYARRLRTLGFSEEHDFWHCPRGHNYRMSNCHAELISKSLKDFGESIKRRRDVEAMYDASMPMHWKMPKRDCPWVYDMRVTGMTGDTQRKLVKALNEEGIGARMSFKPVSMQPEYSVSFSRGREEAFKASSEVIYLPLSPGVTDGYTITRARSIIDKHLSQWN